MKRVIFHIGLPKTATSTIQYTLLMNRTRLREYGVRYPDRCVAYNTAESGHHNVPRQLVRPNLFDPQHGRIEELVAEVRQGAEATVVVSSEGLWNLALNRMDLFRDLIAQFAAVAEVEVVITWRREDEHIESLFLHALHTGQLGHSWAAYRKRAFKNIDRKYGNVVRIAERCEVAVRLQLYDRRTDPVEAFLRVVTGAEPPQLNHAKVTRNLRYGLNYYVCLYNAYPFQWPSRRPDFDLARMSRKFVHRLTPRETRFRLLDADGRTAILDQAYNALRLWEGDGRITFDADRFRALWGETVHEPVRDLELNNLTAEEYDIFQRVLDEEGRSATGT